VDALQDSKEGSQHDAFVRHGLRDFDADLFILFGLRPIGFCFDSESDARRVFGAFPSEGAIVIDSGSPSGVQRLVKVFHPGNIWS
jgi:hypothetical protein